MFVREHAQVHVMFLDMFMYSICTFVSVHIYVCDVHLPKHVNAEVCERIHVHLLYLSVNTFMYIYVYMFMYILVYTFMCMYIMFVYMCMFIFMYMYIMFVCMFIYLFVNKNILAHVDFLLIFMKI